MFRGKVWKARAACAQRLASYLKSAKALLELAFLEFDMLAQQRIVLFDLELLGHGAGVLLGDIEKATVAFAVEADLRGGGLRHDKLQKGQVPKGPSKGPGNGR